MKFKQHWFCLSFMDNKTNYLGYIKLAFLFTFILFVLNVLFFILFGNNQWSNYILSKTSNLNFNQIQLKSNQESLIRKTDEYLMYLIKEHKFDKSNYPNDTK